MDNTDCDICCYMDSLQHYVHTVRDFPCVGHQFCDKYLGLLRYVLLAGCDDSEGG